MLGPGNDLDNDLDVPSHGLSFGIEAIVHSNAVGHLHQVCRPDFGSVNELAQASSIVLCKMAQSIHLQTMPCHLHASPHLKVRPVDLMLENNVATVLYNLQTNAQVGRNTRAIIFLHLYWKR